MSKEFVPDGYMSEMFYNAKSFNQLKNWKPAIRNRH